MSIERRQLSMFTVPSWMAVAMSEDAYLVLHNELKRQEKAHHDSNVLLKPQTSEKHVPSRARGGAPDGTLEN
jgi:hypothetical protein